MTKKFYGLITLLSFLTCIAIFTQHVKADVDYDIDQITVNANVNHDGSLSIHRRIYYDFDSDAHGVFYRQNLNKNQKLSDIQVEVDNKKVKQRKDGRNNTYQLTKDGNSYRFKVFHNIEDGDNVVVEYSYKISNAITNYKDTAELNFKIIGNGWDQDIDYAKININFPGKVKGLKAWGHGPLNGYTKVLPKQGKIIMTADNVPGDQGIEIHSIFPTTVTAANKNIVNKNKKQAIMKQEAQLADEANKARQRKSTASWVLLVISVILSLFAFIRIFFIKYRGFTPRPMSDLAHNYEIPSVSPVVAQILAENEWPNTKAFTAYLMQLAGKKKIKITKEQTKHLKRDYYRITLLDKSVLDDALMAFLFNKIGDGSSFTTRQLNKYSSSKLGKKFKEWRKLQYRAVEEEGYFDEAAKNAKDRQIGITIFLGGISIFVGIFGVIMLGTVPPIFVGIWIAAIALDLISLFIIKKRFGDYTQKGVEEANKVRGFEKMLDDIGNFKMKDVGDIILWEDILPYATAFGLSKKVIKELQVEFGKDELAQVDNNFIFWPLYIGHDSFERSFEKSFSNASSFSSSSGGSGGFSGGSSGGFGGGSGGGAF